MEEYRVRLPAFEGPLDLLLYLVKKNEVDVCDIPVAVIAEQFREHLAVVQALDVEAAGEFLVMATTLLEIKSRLLLPRHNEGEAAEAADPRRELVRQLLDYRRYKEAATQLESQAAERELRLPRGDGEPSGSSPGQPAVGPVELWDLVSAFGRILSESAALAPQEIVADDTPHHVYADEVLGRVRSAGRLAFREVFSPPYHRLRLIGLFLAVLELVKGGAINIEYLAVDADFWLTLPRAATATYRTPAET